MITKIIIAVMSIVICNIKSILSKHIRVSDMGWQTVGYIYIMNKIYNN